MPYPEAAWERAMTVQEVMLKAISGELHWYRAAEVLGWSPRTVRRWRERYEAHGYGGLFDKRRLRPSGRRLPPGQLEALLQLVWSRNSCGWSVVELQEAPETLAASNGTIPAHLLARKEEEVVLPLVIPLAGEAYGRVKPGPGDPENC